MTARHTYTVANFDDKSASELRGHLRELRRSLLDSHSIDAFKSEMWRLKIEDHLHYVLTSEEEEEQKDGEELKRSVSVLFHFVRRPAGNERCLTDVRGWLDRLVAVLLRRKGGDDFGSRLFVLHHVLRCPAGVGRWAAKYVQVPAPEEDVGSEEESQSPFSHPRLKHLLAVLSMMMSPIEKREDFLKAMKSALSLSPVRKGEASDPDSVWSVMDHEGDEDEDLHDTWHLLSDSDLVSIFDQVPLDAFIRHLLRIDKADGEYRYDPTRSSDQNFMQLFAVATALVRELRRGFETFNRPRYRSFAKRLCHAILDVLRFVTNHWLAYKAARIESGGDGDGGAMVKRIQVEYDSFFLRVIRSIFGAHELGTWQYFAHVPYGAVSIDMLWRVFLVLHLDYHDDGCQKLENLDTGAEKKEVDWASELQEKDLLIQFEENLSKAWAAERHFLLTAFSAMAASRDPQEERDFISAASLDIFRVGFVLEGVADLNLAKEARDQLANICSAHPFALSLIVKEFCRDEEEFPRLEVIQRILIVPKEIIKKII